MQAWWALGKGKLSSKSSFTSQTEGLLDIHITYISPSLLCITRVFAISLAAVG
jgi:hypothetical protein